MTDTSSSVEIFETGAIRDTHEGKPRIDLISPFFLEDLGKVLERGARKYHERNWEKGIPESRLIASMDRHLNNLKAGNPGEPGDDNVCQLAFGAMAICHQRHMIERGLLPKSLMDLPNYTPKETPNNGESQQDTIREPRLTPINLPDLRRFSTDHAH